MTTLCINPECPAPENPDDRDRCQACDAQLRLGDRFRPVAKLGQGGFGATWLAQDEAQRPAQPCVVKQLRGSPEQRQRALAEADRLAVLGRHPQIPSLIALLTSTRDLCLVQTYVPGPTLEQVLATDGPFCPTQVRSLLLSLLPVLQFIHDHGIIHRDIKPANIILPGGDLPPVLVDFGAARSAPSATDPAPTGTVIGSAGYAAPEQALGKAVPASDLYSLGVTCLHLLTGQHPFDLYSVAEDCWVWQDYTPPPVAPALARVLERLAARSLRSRYPSAAAALADLAPAGLPTAPRGPQAPLVRVATATWRCVQVWATPDRCANALAVSPDGRQLATGHRDGSVQLWDLSTGAVLHTFAGQRLGWGAGHADAITAVAFAPQEQTLITASQDSTLKQWSLQSYQLGKTLQPPGWQVTAIALSPNGQTLINATADGHLTTWHLATGHLQVDTRRHAGAINDLALAPDGTRLASAGAEGTLRLWYLPDLQLLHTWPPGEALDAVALSAREAMVMTGSARGAVTLWSLTEIPQRQSLEPHQDAVSAIALDTAERWLATGSRDRTIAIWPWPPPSSERQVVLHHDWAVRALTFTPDGQTLISSAADETIRLWQPAT